jgi:hypothetical protein
MPLDCRQLHERRKRRVTILRRRGRCHAKRNEGDHR